MGWQTVSHGPIPGPISVEKLSWNTDLYMLSMVTSLDGVESLQPRQDGPQSLRHLLLGSIKAKFANYCSRCLNF